MMINDPLAMLKEQYRRLKAEIELKNMMHVTTSYNDRVYLAQTGHMILNMYGIEFDVVTNAWQPPRKKRSKILKEQEPVEIWLTNGAKDHACTRYSNTLWNQSEGPIPGTDTEMNDTHIRCQCIRRLVATPGADDKLQWYGVKKPRDRKNPKAKLPKEYQRVLNPYAADDLRQPDVAYP